MYFLSLTKRSRFIYVECIHILFFIIAEIVIHKVAVS